MKNLLVLILTLIAPWMHADILFTTGLNAQLWSTEASGYVDDGVKLDSSGLNIEKESSFYGSVFFEHPIPMIPNLKLANTNLSLSGNGKAAFRFQDIDFEGATDTSLDLSHTDLTLYWGIPLPLPYLDINFGLSARIFDGGAEVKGLVDDQLTVQNAEFDTVLPMLYGKVIVGSLFGFYGYTEINYIGYDGNTLSDATVALGYELPIPILDVNFEGGYRQLNAKTNIDDFDADINIKGPFAGIHLAFGF